MQGESRYPNQIWETVCKENPTRQAQKRNILNDDDGVNKDEPSQDEPAKRLKLMPNKPEQQERPHEIKRRKKK